MTETGDVEWPFAFEGIIESVVTTRGPNDRWNLAALGLHAPGHRTDQSAGGMAGEASDPEAAAINRESVTARTWGMTRTRQNFRHRSQGYVQITDDPVTFVEAALGVRELDEPLLGEPIAWVQVTVDQIDSGTSQGTEWIDWRLKPVDFDVDDPGVQPFNRGYAGVVEATIAASRLDVDAYESDAMLDRIHYYERIANRCGGPRIREAFDRLHELTGR